MSELDRLHDFFVVLVDCKEGRGSATTGTLRSQGIGVSRKLNQAINAVAFSRPNETSRWLEVSTDTLDAALENMDEQTRTLHASTLSKEVDRLCRQISGLQKELRPK